MGIKQYFGDSLLKLLQEAKEKQEKEARLVGSNDFHTLGNRLRDGTPAIVAYRITNGYIVQSLMGHDTHGRQPTLHYCADHQAVAEFIVAEASRQALGLNTQQAYATPEQAMAKAQVRTTRNPY